MPPKGAKRQAAAAGAPAKAAKRGRRADPVLQKCGLVSSALLALDASVLPGPAARLLSEMAPHSLATLKDERHAFQAQTVEMVQDALANGEAFLEKLAQEAKAKSDSVGEDRLARNAALAKAKEDLSACESAVAQKKAALAAATDAHRKSLEGLRDARAAQREADAPFEEAEVLRARAKEATTALETLKTMSTDSKQASGKQAKQHLKTVVDFGKSFNVDASLLDSLLGVLRRDPAARSGFDFVVVQNFETALSGLVSDFESKLGLAAGEAPRAAKAAATQAAETASQEAEQATATAKAEVAGAEAEVKAGAVVVKSAQKAIKNWLPDCKKVMDHFDAKAAELAAFREGALAAFGELKELAPAPEPEPAAEEEAMPAAEEPAATEAAPEAAGEAAP